jgi:SAM-dependent methyltransferase
MIDWFKGDGFNIGELRQGDVYDLSFEKKYDVVFSSGFIEHFTNFEEIIKTHCELVNESGYVFITTPNFAGFIQKKLHSIFDKENLNKHYLPSMNPNKWAEILKKQGFDIINMGYMGGFDFWVGDQKRSFSQRLIIKAIRIFLPLRWLPNSRSYSPEIYVIAQKIIK